MALSKLTRLPVFSLTRSTATYAQLFETLAPRSISMFLLASRWNGSLNVTFGAASAEPAPVPLPTLVPRLGSTGASGSPQPVVERGAVGWISTRCVCLMSFFAVLHLIMPTASSAANASAPILPAPCRPYGWFGATPIGDGGTISVAANAALTSFGFRYVDSDHVCSVFDVSHDSIAGGAT